MKDNKIDWSQYKIKEDNPRTDWSQYKATPNNNEDSPVENDLPIKKPQKRGLIDKTMELFSHAMAKGTDFLTKIPGEIKGITEEFKKSPLGETKHIAGQLGVGATGIGKDIANFALSLLEPLSQLGGIPEGGHPFTYQIPEKTGLQDALGLESNKKGDELIKAIPEIVSLAYGGSAFLKKGYKSLATANPLSKESKLRNAMTENIINAKKIKQEASKDLSKATDKLKYQYAEQSTPKGQKIGSLNPVDQKIEALAKQEKIKELEPLANIPKKEIKVEPEPDYEKVIQQAKEEKTKASELLSEALRSHEPISLKAGEKIKQHLNKLHDSASSLYNRVESAYKGKYIAKNNTAEINKISSDLQGIIKEDLMSGDSLAPGYGSATSEQQALEAKINTLKSEKVKASDAYDVLRTLQNRAQKARDASFKPGLDKIERTRLQKLAHLHEKEAVKLGKQLESVGDPNTKQMLKSANENWKAYKDISRSKVGKSILRNEGNIPADTMLKIEGTGKGNEHLRELVKQDPELGRYLFGQKYAKANQQNKIFEKSDLTDRYLKNLPQDIQSKVTDLKVALKKVANPTLENGQTIKEAKDTRKALVKALEEQNIRQKSATEIKELTKQVKFHLDAAKETEAKIKAEELAGKNVDKLQEDFARHKREYINGDSKLTKLKSRLLQLVGTKGAYELLFKDDHHSR